MTALPVVQLQSSDLIQNGGRFKVAQGPAIAVRVLTGDTGIGGGAAQPVYVVSDSELSQNGGRFKVMGRDTPLTVRAVTAGQRPAVGGAALAVYPVEGAF